MTVKDVLEGDNKYTCSQCDVKVRAEKRYNFIIKLNLLQHNQVGLKKFVMENFRGRNLTTLLPKYSMILPTIL